MSEPEGPDPENDVFPPLLPLPTDKNGIPEIPDFLRKTKADEIVPGLADIQNIRRITQLTPETHNFTTTVMETVVLYQAKKMSNCLYLWIGGPDKMMKDLSFSAPTPYDKGYPVATQILGNGQDNISQSIASRLSKRLKKPVYLSFNVQFNMALANVILRDIQARIIEEMTVCPDKF